MIGELEFSKKFMPSDLFVTVPDLQTTYGTEVSLNHIWTVIFDETNNNYAVPGIQKIENIIGYLYTQKQWHEDTGDALFFDASCVSEIGLDDYEDYGDLVEYDETEYD